MIPATNTEQVNILTDEILWFIERFGYDNTEIQIKALKKALSIVDGSSGKIGRAD